MKRCGARAAAPGGRAGAIALLLGSALLFAAGCSGLGLDSRGYELRRPRAIGERCLYRLDTSFDSKTSIPSEGGRAEVVQQTGEQTMRFALTALETTGDGGRRVALEFLGLRLDVRSGGQRAVFEAGDSGAPHDPASTSRVLEALVGQKVVLLVDADGFASDVEGMTALKERVVAGLSAAERRQIEGLFNPESMRQLFYQVSPGDMPNGPVHLGDGWSRTTQMPLAGIGLLGADIVYQFARIEQRPDRECAVVTFSGALTGRAGEVAVPNGARIESIKGNLVGRSAIDVATGVWVEGLAVTDIDMTLKASPAAASLITIHSRQDVRTVLESVERAGAPAGSGT